MTHGSPTFLPALSPWPATPTCPYSELQAEGISASPSFSVWSWGALDSDVIQLSKLLQHGPLGPPGAAVKCGTIDRGSRKCCLFMFWFVPISVYDLFAQRPFLFLKHFGKLWLKEALALPAPENYLLHLGLLPNTPPNRALPPGLLTVAPRL